MVENMAVKKPIDTWIRQDWNDNLMRW